MICPNCGHKGNPGSSTKGSFLIEVVLWCCFIVPGIIYSLWRLTTKQKVCPSCKEPGMISEDSPRGKKLMKEYSHKK
jgi:hypothetical protein